jgi:hypothetical protein
MPRYMYHCGECNKTNFVFHGINELHNICLHCEGVDCLDKMLTKPTIKKEVTKDKKVGELTNKYIKDNKKILEELKEECKEASHEPS